MSITVPSVQPISAEGYEPVSEFGATLINAMAPWVTRHLAWYLDAIGVMCQDLVTLVSDEGVDDGTTPTIGTFDADGNLITEGYAAGYSILLDPSRCPDGDLGFLAQFPGVVLPLGVDATTARSLIEAESGLNRGTPAAVIAAAKRNLTGTQSVTYIEREYVDGTPDAGWAGIVVLTSELKTTLQDVEDAVLAVKFGGIQMWFQAVTSFTWAEQTRTWGSDTRTWRQAAHEL